MGMRRGAAGREHAAITQEAIEDARQAASERDDGDVLLPRRAAMRSVQGSDRG